MDALRELFEVNINSTEWKVYADPEIGLSRIDVAHILSYADPSKSKYGERVCGKNVVALLNKGKVIDYLSFAGRRIIDGINLLDSKRTLSWKDDIQKSNLVVSTRDNRKYITCQVSFQTELFYQKSVRTDLVAVFDCIYRISEPHRDDYSGGKDSPMVGEQLAIVFKTCWVDIRDFSSREKSAGGVVKKNYFVVSDTYVVTEKLLRDALEEFKMADA
jgi:hypothetical protein